MAGRVYEWDDYFIPGTGVLKNLPGLTDSDQLYDYEYAKSLLRQQQIELGIAKIPATLDGEHLQALHRYLLQDVYEWAGEFRTVNIVNEKPRDMWADPNVKEVGHFVHHQNMPQALNFLTDMIDATDWHHLDADQMASKLADVHSHVNMAHPFREGNGRVTRLFVEAVADHAGYDIRGPLPDKKSYIRAVILADDNQPSALEAIWRSRIAPLPSQLERPAPPLLAERVARLRVEAAPQIAPTLRRAAGYYGPSIN
ncbi:Fic/DOC family protein [Demequina sp.]|uniref:Fic/DOC family protein n=1 Tax=Demequina sp. TaxID=2050685 RepID=UPI003D0CAEDE